MALPVQPLVKQMVIMMTMLWCTAAEPHDVDVHGSFEHVLTCVVCVRGCHWACWLQLQSQNKIRPRLLASTTLKGQPYEFWNWVRLMAFVSVGKCHCRGPVTPSGAIEH